MMRYNLFTKLEANLGKVKERFNRVPRIITSCAHAIQSVYGPYFKQLASELGASTTASSAVYYAIGGNLEDWTEWILNPHPYKFMYMGDDAVYYANGKWYLIDLSKFDGTQYEFWMGVMKRYYREIFVDRGFLKFWWCVASIKRCISKCGLYLKFKFRLNSGVPETSAQDSLSQDMIGLSLVGRQVSDTFTIQRTYEACGFRVKLEEVPFEEISFCQNVLWRINPKVIATKT
jgi:hypothetical protein